MNLPILYWASEQSKDSRFAWIAKKFADTAIEKYVDGNKVGEINP